MRKGHKLPSVGCQSDGGGRNAIGNRGGNWEPEGLVPRERADEGNGEDHNGQ